VTPPVGSPPAATTLPAPNATASDVPLLNSTQMAQFTAKGFLRFDAVVPAEVNALCIEEMVAEVAARRDGVPSALGTGNAAGIPLARCFLEADGIRSVLDLPLVRGLIASLAGPDPIYDHHAVHVRNPGEPAQELHADAIIDTRLRFDIQLMYYPHDVDADMGGTLIVPGSHLRRVNEHDISRYQNLLGQLNFFGPAGTIMVLHHGIWHCGRRNKQSAPRYMFKLRLNPAGEQVRCWDTSDLADDGVRHQVLEVLRTREPWYEASTGRLDLVNRAALWRYLSGRADFDLDYWFGRLANAARPALLDRLPGSNGHLAG
jgi:Phytanoyl-CoA dioxygenase (PhyH)